MAKEMTPEEAWKKYNMLKDNIQQACDKMADFVCWEIGGYGHLADGFNDDLYEDFAIAEEVMEKHFGKDPEAEDWDCEEDDEEGLKPDFDEDGYGNDWKEG